MKKVITIKSLALNNFKGIKSLHVDFENETDIYGANASGKTTVFDAFTWLLFGKDSSDRKDFEVKTLDGNGRVIPKIEHEVSAVMIIDGETFTFKRVLKENWVKKKGTEIPEFSGNVTDLYWNEVPVNVTEFNRKLNDLITEVVFKIITSPTYFPSLEWKKQREILIQLVGEISDLEIAEGNENYKVLLSKLTLGKTLEDYNLQIQNSIKKAKEDLKAIPTRIDEVNRSKPEALDFDALETRKEEAQNELEEINGQLESAGKAFQSVLDGQKDLKIKANNLKGDIETIELDAKKETEQRLKPNTEAYDKAKKSYELKNGELNSSENLLTTLAGNLGSIEAKIKTNSDLLAAKRELWEKENAKMISFDDQNFCCPTCVREFDAADIESKKAELTESFANNKQITLSKITQEGQSLSIENENLGKEAATLKQRIETEKQSVEVLKSEITILENNVKLEESKINSAPTQSFEVVYQSILDLNTTYQAKKIELQEIKFEDVPEVDNTELTEKRKALVDEIDNIKGQLNLKLQIEACEKREGELRDEEKKLSKQIADVEREQFIIENFIKDKINRFEERINSKFKLVQFKMFKEQINGGYTETCEAMVNGVPYSNVNSASKINAGLDIINTLSDFYGVSAPIFIDNAESVHTLIGTDSQLIRLVVSEMHKKLEVKSNALVA